MFDWICLIEYRCSKIRLPFFFQINLIGFWLLDMFSIEHMSVWDLSMIPVSPPFSLLETPFNVHNGSGELLTVEVRLVCLVWSTAGETHTANKKRLVNRTRMINDELYKTVKFLNQCLGVFNCDLQLHWWGFSRIGFFPHWIFPWPLVSPFFPRIAVTVNIFSKWESAYRYLTGFKFFFYSMTWTFIQKKSNIELLNVQYRTSKIRDRSYWKRVKRPNPVKDLPWMTVMEDIRSVKKWNVQCLQPTEPRGHLRLGRS